MSNSNSPSDDRMVDRAVALRLAGKLYPEIASIVGISVNSVKLRVIKAVKRGVVTARQVRYRPNPLMTDAEYDRRYIERLRAKTIVAENGCHVWQGAKTSKGYIMLQHRKYRGSGHRVAYRLLKKPDLTTSELVCHKCDNRCCWNTEHMFLGTEADNNRDCGDKGRHHNSVKTRCKFGHEFTPENTYLKVTPTTVMRACKTCQRERQRVARLANPEKARERSRRYRAAKAAT